MNRAQLLFQLQNLDSEADGVRQRLARIKAQLGESDSLKKARAAVEAADKGLRHVQAQVQDLELETKSLLAKIAQEEKALYGGRAVSAKEAANLQGEISSLKRRREKREETLLEAMVDAEAAESRLTAARGSLAALEAEWRAGQQTLLEEQDRLQAKAARLIEQRPTIAETIDPEDLRQYEALRPKKGGRAVAVVVDGICQGCGMAPSHNKVQQARLGAELVYCGGCGRILYVS